MNIEKTVSNLKIRGFQVSCFNTSAEAAEYLKNMKAAKRYQKDVY